MRSYISSQCAESQGLWGCLSSCSPIQGSEAIINLVTYFLSLADVHTFSIDKLRNICLEKLVSMWFVLATLPPTRMTQPNPGLRALPLTIDTAVGVSISKVILKLGVGPTG